MAHLECVLRTTRDAFPLPIIEEALDTLGQAKFFSSLDLTSGYWQVEVAEADKYTTAFSTPMGLYECNHNTFWTPECSCNIPKTDDDMPWRSEPFVCTNLSQCRDRLLKDSTGACAMP